MVSHRRRVHVIGVCGRATGALASELAERGWRVSGSDEGAFPPATDILAGSPIRVFPTFRSEQVPRDADCVIVGSCFGREIPEVEAAFDQGIPVVNFAQFIGAHLLSARERFVVAGTNGKTTTTAMLAWIFEATGRSPDFLIGGSAPDLPAPARFRGGDRLVIEGDEYPGGHWDPRPKFASYDPTVGILTNVHHDHPEIFSGLPDVQRVFGGFAGLLPEDGLLIANADDPNSAPVIAGAPCRVETVGTSRSSDFRISQLFHGLCGAAFTFQDVRVRLRLHGEMNARNAAMAMRAAIHSGIRPADAAAALSSFRGVKGRQELLQASDRFAHITDIAYHPDAIRNLLASVRSRFPSRRVLLALQPQNTGVRSSDYQRNLRASIKAADRVFLTKPFDFGARPEDAFDQGEFARTCAAEGFRVDCLEFPEDVPGVFAERARKGDVLVSSLGFLAAPTLEELNKIGAEL